MKYSACLIYNPASGQGDAEIELQKICNLLEPEISLDVQLTTEMVGADKLAAAAIRRGTSTIIASGGDGTVSAVADVLVGTHIPLGIIPRGTANSFAKALGLPVNLESACQKILRRCTRVVDTATCNGRAMILYAGIGFGAEAHDRADRSAKDRYGIWAYIQAGIQQLNQMEPFEAIFETEEGKKIAVDALAITVANAASSASILAQGSDAVLVDDGLLDVTVIGPTSKTRAVANAIHLARTASQGKVSRRSDIGYFRVRSIEITAAPPQKVVLDGELIGTTPVDIRCMPNSLIIIS